MFFLLFTLKLNSFVMIPNWEFKWGWKKQIGKLMYWHFQKLEREVKSVINDGPPHASRSKLNRFKHLSWAHSVRSIIIIVKLFDQVLTQFYAFPFKKKLLIGWTQTVEKWGDTKEIMNWLEYELDEKYTNKNPTKNQKCPKKPRQINQIQVHLHANTYLNGILFWYIWLFSSYRFSISISYPIAWVNILMWVRYCQITRKLKAEAHAPAHVRPTKFRVKSVHISAQRTQSKYFK